MKSIDWKIFEEGLKNLEMVVKDNKIVECTEEELFNYYLSRGFDDIYSFPEYKQAVINKGTKVID